MAGIYSQGGSAGHRYAGWLSEVEAKNFQFGGKVFNGSPSAIYVGSNLVWANWLTQATKQAILGAFGQTDGKAVIKATNAYLNQLAASDRDKATALAGFINEDPMLACSVAGNAPKVRRLRNTGDAYVITDYVPNASTNIETSFVWEADNPNANNEVSLFGARVSGNMFNYFVRARNSEFGYWMRGGSVPQVPLPSKNVVYDLKSDGAKLTVGTNVITAAANTGSVGYALRIFDNNIAGSESRQNSLFRGRIADVILTEGANVVRHIAPFVSETRNGMIDIVNVTFYPNQGSTPFVSVLDTP